MPRRFETDAGAFFAKWNGALRRTSSRARPWVCARWRLGFHPEDSRGRGRVGPARRSPAFIVMEYLETRARRPPPPTRRPSGAGLAELHRPPRSASASPRHLLRRDPPTERLVGVLAGVLRDSDGCAPLMDAVGTERGLAGVRARPLRPPHRPPARVLPAEAIPALIHGDLWSGNVLWTARARRSWTPPAPTPSARWSSASRPCSAASRRAPGAPTSRPGPCPADWRERNPLYQLYHLLNHYLLFGGGYGAQARQIARQFA